jgi:ribose/xylose/arabinose/galactoside ABC-type transport system permease subunit
MTPVDRDLLAGLIGRWAPSSRAAIGSLVVLVAMVAVLFVANPPAFSNWTLYRSVLTTVPIAIFLTVPLVFIVTAGDIDLSFPATMGLSALAFAALVSAGHDPFLALAVALAAGATIGLAVGALVVYGSLSALIATLGMNFLLRGLIMVLTEARSISLGDLGESGFRNLLTGFVGDVPAQIVWAAAFALGAALVYRHHRFGVHVHIVGDSPQSAHRVGIDVKSVRLRAFVFMGLGAALAGVFSTLINLAWWPTAGDGYLLPVLASVFVGGTPYWGGAGTVLGGAIGAVTVSFIQTGVVAAGLSGYHVQLASGAIIILSLLGHRSSQVRYR